MVGRAAHFELGPGRWCGYSPGMDTDPPPQVPPQAWLDALEEGEADLAAGHVGPWPPLRDAIEAVLAAIERGADDAERKRLLQVVDAIAEGTHEDAPAPPHR